METLSGWLLCPENRAASQAVEWVSACVGSARPRRRINPLFVHGPAGTGKTRLLRGLVAEILRQRADLPVAFLAAADLAARDEADEERHAARQAELVVLEDLQHLPTQGQEALAALVDHCVARHVQIVLSAVSGPGRLSLPIRLTSRLASGLVVGLELLGTASRREFLRQTAQQRHLPIDSRVLTWLAENTPGSVRQLEGALTRLANLAQTLERPPDLELVCQAFHEDAETRRLTVERIAQRVGSYFQVEPARLRSPGRTREVLVPRQVGMYLARKLTALSLEQIGAYFGGRDHSTVLHACRKVERALAEDARLSGAVHQLHAELG